MRSLVAVALLLVNSHALAVEQSRRTESSATANAHALSDIPSVKAHSTSSSDAFDTNEERAQSHLEEARKLFKTAKFESAIVELNQSYALFPRPICLFNIGQAYRRLGKRSEAIASFERFVAADPKRILQVKHKTP